MDDDAPDRTTPISPDDVLPLPTPHLDRARQRARHVVADATQRERQAAAAVNRAARELADARSRMEVTRAARQERSDALATAEADRTAASERFAAARAEVQAASDGVDAAQRTLAPIAAADEAMATLIDAGPPQGPDDVPACQQKLEAAARLVEALDRPPGTTALTTWAEQLATGTAPVRDDAAALLGELERLGSEWHACGEGDLDRDPAVVAALAEVEKSRQAVAAVQAGGLGTAAGHQARTAIEMAHQRRTQLEASGRRADPAELALAVREEDAALAHVGFDSWLDFRLTMSGAGVGALVERRRRVAADELAAAEASLRQVREERAAHHESLRAQRDRVRRRAVDEVAVDGSRPLAEQLRQVLALPAPVHELGEEVRCRADAARAQLAAAQDRHGAARRSLDEMTQEDERAGLEVERRRRALERAESDLEAAEAQLVAAEAAAAEQHEHAEGAARESAEAAAQLDELERAEYLPDDLDDVITTVVRLADERVGAGVTPQLLDPLAALPVAATLQLVDRLEAVGQPAELISSRRALLSAMRRRSGVVSVVDGRRRRRPFAQRRNREPIASTR